MTVNLLQYMKVTRKLLQKQWLIYRASSRLKSKTGIDRAMTAVQTPTLNHFSEDLTMLAKIGGLDLSIDRENEYEEIFRILEGSSIKTVILVGDPGVGKTAIVEGLAQKMIADDVPDFLQDKRLVSLSISRLIAGAAMGEAQERLLICLSEIINAGNIVLFIDNLHDLMLIAEGGSLIEVLTESLSKNLLVLIASSNSINYKKYIENTSLGNIIKKIDISEPDIDGAIQIIEGKASFIEGKNNIYLSYDAIETAVKLTDRYIHDQFLPYKAITILEEVAVWAKKNKGAKALVTGNDLAILFSEKINMPVSQITESESEKLLNLEQIIHDRMIDQEEAVSAVANSLRRARAELREIKRPIANLLFLGPTGVGKTELAKTIAEVYFNSEENMIRLDMSEYQEKNSINRLIGAPPGYAGAGEGGVLTEAVRQRPYSIVLLDELEKAHPDILNLFLQVMDDGRLTDSSGRTIDFTNVILIATSNAQTNFIQQKLKEGLTIPQIKDQLLQTELKQYFKPEFINRFDNIIVFKPLSMEDIIQITKLMLKKVAKALEEKGVNFQTTEDAVKELAQIGFDPQYGARPLRRVIQDKVDNALANYLLTGKIGRRDIAIFDKGGIIRIEKAEKL
jgi:ATP-dependent Clp protease ATP-binding subunit ClpC